MAENGKVEILWNAPFYDTSGYGRASTRYLWAFYHHLKKVSHIKVNALSFSKNPNPLDPVTAGYVKNKVSERAITLQHVTPDMFQKKKDSYVVGMTTFEASHIPFLWVQCCNAVDEVWVPSKYCKKSFEHSGVNKRKIKIIHHGIDLTEFKSAVDPLRIKNKKGFNFLINAQWNYRKGFDVLLKAYLQEFNHKDDVALILKTFGIAENHNEMRKIYRKILDIKNKIGKVKNPLIIMVEERVGDIAALYTAADCYVSPHRSEGWGQCLTEAMACELPVIATGKTGNMEFMNRENSYLIKSSPVKIKEDEMRVFRWYDETMTWEEPDLKDLKAKMRYVFEHQDEAKEMGKKARESIKHLTWKEAAKKMFVKFKEAYILHNQEIFKNRKQQRADKKQNWGKKRRLKK